MPRLTALAVAMLVALPLASLDLVHPARADATVFTLPPFREGDAASYTDSADGPLNLSVGAPTTALDKGGRTVAAVPVSYAPWGRIEYFSARTMTLEQVFTSCAAARNADGTCSAPYQGRDWTQQGAPAIFGATYLQGRSFQIGDAWSIAGDCAFCTFRTVTIETPNAHSPPGTDFVAHVQADYSPLAFTGRIHMNATSPFPLLVEPATGPVVGSPRLVGATPGSTPIAPPTPPEAASHSPALPILPFDHGRPVEGTPLPGWPSWSDARNATGPDDADATPGATFVSVYLPLSTAVTHEDRPSTGFAVATSYDIQSRYAIPGAADNLTDYHTLNATVAGAQTPLVYESATHGTAPPSTLGACANRSIPLWDAARFALALPYLHEFRGLSLDTHGPTSCAAGELLIEGQIYRSPNLVVGLQEDVSFTATEGYLDYAHSIAPS